MVSVAEIDRSLPQSDKQADGQEMTSAFPVAMETWGWGGVVEPGLGICRGSVRPDILQASSKLQREEWMSGARLFDTSL